MRFLELLQRHSDEPAASTTLGTKLNYKQLINLLMTYTEHVIKVKGYDVMQGATTRRIFHLLRPGRLVRDQQLRYYYVKEKRRRRGPSGQAWLALAGVTTTIAGVSIYLLGEPELCLI